MSRKKYEFSYKDNSGYHFIDPVTYEDITFQEEFVAKVKNYLTENIACDVIFTDEKAGRHRAARHCYAQGHRIGRWCSG